MERFIKKHFHDYSRRRELLDTTIGDASLRSRLSPLKLGEGKSLTSQACFLTEGNSVGRLTLFPRLTNFKILLNSSEIICKFNVNDGSLGRLGVYDGRLQVATVWMEFGFAMQLASRASKTDS